VELLEYTEAALKGIILHYGVNKQHKELKAAETKRAKSLKCRISEFIKVA